MTDRELIAEMRSNSLLNRVRQVISCGTARIEQAQAQRRPMSVLEFRHEEFALAAEVIALVGRERALFIEYADLLWMVGHSQGGWGDTTPIDEERVRAKELRRLLDLTDDNQDARLAAASKEERT